MVLLANYIDVNQFEHNETTQACGPFNIEQQKYAYRDGTQPVGTPETIDQEADELYTLFIGPNTQADLMGTSVDTFIKMSNHVGLRTRLIASSEKGFNVNKLNAETAIAWLKAGYVLSAAIYETSVKDVELNDMPWNWKPQPTVSHIIALCGLDDKGHFLVHDTANIDKNGIVRKGPRTYENSLKFLSLFAVFLPWKQVPPNGYDPTENQWVEVVHLPGWTDNGKELRNNVTPFVVVDGFRLHLLNETNEWEHWNVPMENEKGRTQLELSNKGLGGGTEQTFYAKRLEWTPNPNRVFEAWIGRELLYIEKMKTPVSG